MMMTVTEDRTDERAPVAASVLNRLAARLLDGLLFVPLRLIVDTMLHTESHASGNGAWSLSQAIPYVAVFLYEVILTWRFGQTLGKRMIGIRVRDVVDNRPPTLLRSVTRVTMVTYLPTALFGTWLSSGARTLLILAWGLVLAGSILLRPDGRGLHDLAARTRVVAT